MIPNHGLGILMTIDIGLGLCGLLITVFGIWILLRQSQQTAFMVERVANIAERIDARLRRDFPNIGDNPD